MDQLRAFVDPPKISISLHYDCEIKKCTVSAEVETNWPVLSAKWQKDQHNISISGNVSEYVDKEKDYLLFIRYCQRKDEGLYRMVAETVAGRSYSKEITFEIEGIVHVTVVIALVYSDKITVARYVDEWKVLIVSFGLGKFSPYVNDC